MVCKPVRAVWAATIKDVLRETMPVRLQGIGIRASTGCVVDTGDRANTKSIADTGDIEDITVTEAVRVTVETGTR